MGHRSGLVVNVDHYSARAALVALVDGQGRFVSGATVPSTALPPIDDVAVGAKQALRAIEEHTGLHLMSAEGVVIPSSGDHGVDVFTITGQPAPPTRLNVVALGNSPLTAPLIAAARRTTTVIDVASDHSRTSAGAFSAVLLESAVREFRPDALVLIQGDAADAEWAAAIGTVATLVGDGVVNLIIIVASDQYQRSAAQLMGDRADLRGIDPAEFAIPDIAAALEAELQSLYDARVDPHALVWASEPTRFVSRVRAGDLVTRFLARRRNMSVVSIDMADGLLIHWASPEVSDVMVRPDVDMFRNVRGVFASELGQISQWLPFAQSHEELAHWVLNRALRPQTVPETAQDMAIERAILIELARAVWAGMTASNEGRIDLIIAGRPFSTMHSPALATLGLLDVFQPDPASGIVDIVLDTDGLLFAAGAIGERSPAIAADVVEHDLLTPFAAAVVVKGSGAEGDLAVRGQIRYTDGETARFTVAAGALHRVSIDTGRAATVSLVCESGFTIGGEERFQDLLIGGDDATILPGEMGILIDARGRPLRHAADAGSRAHRVSSWLDELGFRFQ
jgi:hypothetical protein